MPQTIDLYGVIGWDVSARSIVRQLSNIADQDDTDVELHINSGGGFVDEAVAIYNRLVAHPGNVTVVIDALAASAATVIAMAGDTIIMPDNAQMMVHQPWALAMGTADDLRETAGLLDMTEDSMIKMYSRRTGLGSEQVRSLLADETWMSAEAAAEFGFADQVTESGPGVERAKQAAATSYRAVAHHQTRLKDYASPPEWARLSMDDPRPNQPSARVRAETEEPPQEKEMPRENPQETPESTPEAGVTQPEPVDTQAVARAERERVRAIMALGEKHSVSAEVTDRLIDNGRTVASAKAEILDWIGSQSKAANAINPVGTISGGEGGDRMNRAKAVEREIMARAGLLPSSEAAKERQSNPYASFSLSEMCLAFAESRGGSRLESIGRVLAHGQNRYHRPAADIGITHTTGDFTSILENIAFKSMLKGWEEAPENWEEWCNIGTLADFKQASRAALNTFSDLDEVPEGDEYRSGEMGDRNVDVQLATYGKLFGVTRQALMNDDMSAFTRVPQRMGRAAARKVGDLAYGILTDNNDFGDGTNLFAAGHSNTAAEDIDRGGVQALRVAMTTQTDPTGNTLNIQPSIVLAPENLSLKATEITQAQLISLSSAGVTNVQAGSLRVVTNPRLDAADNTHWYLIADPAAYDTVEVSFLQGNRQPFLEQMDGWKADGTQYKVRIDATATALDYRSMQRGTSGTPT